MGDVTGHSGGPADRADQRRTADAAGTPRPEPIHPSGPPGGPETSTRYHTAPGQPLVGTVYPGSGQQPLPPPAPVQYIAAQAIPDGQPDQPNQSQPIPGHAVPARQSNPAAVSAPYQPGPPVPQQHLPTGQRPGGSQVSLTPDQIAARTAPIQWQLEDVGAARRRRHLLLSVLVGAGVLVVALLVVVTLALTNKPAKGVPAAPAAAPTPTPSQRPTPSLDDALTDTAPTTLDALLPDDAVKVGGRIYQPALRRSSSDCAASAGRAYASAMRTELCGQLLRATYTGPHGIDVTLGIAVFDTKPQVDHVVAALRQAGNFNDPFLLPMPAAAMGKFTVGAGPLSTARPVGRYLVLAVAAYADGHAFTRNDVPANHAVGDLIDHAEETLRARTGTPSVASPSTG